MKKVFIVFCLLFFLCSNFLFGDNINEKLKKSDKELSHGDFKTIDMHILHYWKKGIYKDFYSQEIKGFKSKNYNKRKGLNINGKYYKVGSFIPSNTNKISDGDKLEAYTLFNVLYYLDNKSGGMFPSIALSSLGTVTLGMWAGEYANYQASTNPDDAQRDRAKVILWECLSIGTVGYFGYEVYQNWDQLSSLKLNRETNNLILGLSTAFLIGSVKMWRINEVNYEWATPNSSKADEYRNKSNIYAGVSALALINLGYQIYRNRDYFLELF